MSTGETLISTNSNLLRVDERTDIHSIYLRNFDGQTDFDFISANGATLGPDTTTVSGTVQDTSGDPVGAAIVDVFNESNELVANARTNSSGGYSVTLPENGEYLFKASKFGDSSITLINTSQTDNYDLTLEPDAPPSITQVRPTPGAYVRESPVELRATVADPSPPDVNSSINVSFVRATQNGEVLIAQSSGPNRTATYGWSPPPGRSRWLVRADDGVNPPAQTQLRTISTPGVVTVFDAETLQPIGQANLTVQSTTTSSYRVETTVSDGRIDLGDLPEPPPREELILGVNASGYAETALVVDDPADNYSAVAYPIAGDAADDAGDDVFEQSFRLDDRTGSYPEDESILEIWTDTSDGERLVRRERFGATNEVTGILRDGVRYRLEVYHDGQSRSVGAFVADIDRADEVIDVVIEATSDGDGADTETPTPDRSAPPNVSIAADPSNPIVNETIVVAGLGASADTYWFDLDRDPDFETKRSRFDATTSFNTSGYASLGVRVQNDAGVNATSRIRLYVAANESDTIAVPSAAFSYEPRRPATGQAVSVRAAAPRANVSEYRWDFDADAVTDAYGRNTTNIYTTGGQKRIRLTVVGPNGTRNESTRVVTVEGAGPGSGGYVWDATFDDDTTPPEITFTLSTTGQATVRNVELMIYREGNADTPFVTRQFGSTEQIRHVEPLTVANASDATWIVEWSGQLDGRDVGGRAVLGEQQQPLGIPLAPHWRRVAALAAMMLVGGLFSTRNAAIGGVTTSLTGGLFWWGGWLPPALGATTVATMVGLTVLYLVLSRNREAEA
jgi:hypothetical protein